MKKIVQILQSFYKDDYHRGYYLSCFIFCMILVVLQYIFHFPAHFFARNNNKLYEFLAYVMLYGSAFIVPFFIRAWFYRNKKLPINKSAYLTIAVVVLMFAFRSHFHQYRQMVPIWFADNTRLGYAITDNFFQALALLLPILIIYWYLRPKNHFYGLLKKPDTLKPYWYMLILMLPLILLAATQADFQSQYPKYHSSAGADSGHIQSILFFELAYLFDFVIIELYFRGYIVMALKPYLGKAVVLPMVCLYVSIHLWKPAGETISSFFGGYLLGVLAYETESIWGGIIAHCGIALMMELAGTLFI